MTAIAPPPQLFLKVNGLPSTTAPLPLIETAKFTSLLEIEMLPLDIAKLELLKSEARVNSVLPLVVIAVATWPRKTARVPATPAGYVTLGYRHRALTVADLGLY